jgi:ribonuclease Z
MSFSLTILGSNSAIPTSKRFTTSQVLNIDEHLFLIDCGEGTQIQLQKYKIKFGKINHIFISHIHGDHFLGLLGLISTFNLLGRTNELNIYSCPELEDILNCQLKYFENHLRFKLIFHHLNCKEAENIYEDDKLTVKTIPLKHKIPTCGFLFTEKPKLLNIKKELIEIYNIPIKEIIKIKKGADFITENGKLIKNEKLTISPPKPRSYAFCSDTAYNESIIPIIKNIDLLYHEATFMHNFEKRAEQTYHSTTVQAATIAKKADVKQLIIGHFSARYRKDINSILEETKKIFGNTQCAEDGKTILIGEQ